VEKLLIPTEFWCGYSIVRDKEVKSKFDSCSLLPIVIYSEQANSSFVCFRKKPIINFFDQFLKARGEKL